MPAPADDRSRATLTSMSRLHGYESGSWGGSRIIRYTKDGDMDLEVVFPSVLHVTACTFGGKQVLSPGRGLVRYHIHITTSGPNNDQLYVTTAHCGACGGDGSRQADYPDSGNVFVVDFSGQFTGGEWRFPFAG